MKFDRLVVSTERKRLSGQLPQRGTQTGLSSVGTLFFGLPFFGAGIWAALAGTRVIPLDESKLHAPHWVLTMFGIVFAAAGLLLWSMCVRQFNANRRQRELGQRSPVLADYPWNERAFTPRRWSQVAKKAVGVIFIGLFLSMFNWWAFFAKGPLMVKIIVGLFDLILILAAGQVGLLICRTLKFGPSRIEFARFPYRPGETVSLHWAVPTGMTRIARGTFILRCVEEWHEVTGTGKNRTRRLVHETIWSATGHLDQPQELQPDRTEELQFEIPADAPGTRMNAKDSRPTYWELAVELDLAGLDFRETYLVPIYRNDDSRFGELPAMQLS